MPKLPALKPKEVIQILERAGFYLVHKKGSHFKFKDKSGHVTIVPVHKKDMKRGLLEKIIEDTGLTSREFLRLRKKRKS